MIKEAVSTNRIINLIEPGDKVLLIQDGVLLLSSADSKSLREFKEKNAEIIALREDVELRGIQNNANITLTDYDGFVELLVTNKTFS